MLGVDLARCVFVGTLRQHHGGAPTESWLEAVHVAIDVIADVEHPVATDFGHLLEVDDVAALAHHATAQVLCGYSRGNASSGVDLIEGIAIVEEDRLPSADDDEVEVVAPARIGLT